MVDVKVLGRFGGWDVRGSRSQREGGRAAFRPFCVAFSQASSFLRTRRVYIFTTSSIN
jgi:hypothetical protein